MTESEQALWDTAQSKTNHEARIAKQLLNDSKFYSLWESRHANLVLPVAQESRAAPQVLKLRDIKVGLVHRQALIDHIRTNKIVGGERDDLFRTFYGPRAITNAILIEHRQYMLAVSSWVSSLHLLKVMEDPQSVRMLRTYKKLYANYFDLYCAAAASNDPTCRDATMMMVTDARQRTREVREMIRSEKPQRGVSDVARQALLARSGRYPVQNYMVG